MWRNGIYPYAHYHSMIHEALVIGRGRAKVRVRRHSGGRDRHRARRRRHPAGRHRASSLTHSPDLVVIGAYPPSGKYNLAAAARPSTPRRSPRSLKCRCPRPIRSSAKGAADRAVASMISDWLAFWDSSHSIYVNARHKDVHYRLIAQQIAALVSTPASAGARLRLRRGATRPSRRGSSRAALPVRSRAKGPCRRRRALCRSSQNPSRHAARGRAFAGAFARSHRAAFGRAISFARRIRELLALFRRLLKPAASWW